MDKNNKWEIVNKEANSETQRLKIPGGWIYHLSIECYGNRELSYASTFFVPEPDKCIFHDVYVCKACPKCLEENKK